MEIVKDDKLLETAKSFFSDFEKVRPHIYLVKFDKGTYIYENDNHKKYAFYLIKGKISVYANSITGKQLLIRLCEEPIFIGDMEILGFNKDSNTIRTLEKSIFIAFEMDFLKKVIKTDIVFANYMCKVLAEKMVYFSNIQMSNKMNTVYENLANYILTVSDETEVFSESLVKLSEIMGTSYRHIHRVVSRFVLNDIIEKSQFGYRVLDREKLKSIAEGNLEVIGG